MDVFLSPAFALLLRPAHPKGDKWIFFPDPESGEIGQIPAKVPFPLTVFPEINADAGPAAVRRPVRFAPVPSGLFSI